MKINIGNQPWCSCLSLQSIFQTGLICCLNLCPPRRQACQDSKKNVTVLKKAVMWATQCRKQLPFGITTLVGWFLIGIVYYWYHNSTHKYTTHKNSEFW
jgi:hypothetical protein